jgi:hypothetical protein
LAPLSDGNLPVGCGVNLTSSSTSSFLLAHVLALNAFNSVDPLAIGLITCRNQYQTSDDRLSRQTLRVTCVFSVRSQSTQVCWGMDQKSSNNEFCWNIIVNARVAMFQDKTYMEIAYLEVIRRSQKNQFNG